MNPEETAKALRQAARIQERIVRLQVEYAEIMASLSTSGNGNGTVHLPSKRRGHPMSEASKRKLRQVARARWKKAKASGKARL